MKLNIVGWVLFAAQMAAAQSLSLDAYKAQVMEKDPETQAVLEQKEGAELTVRQPDLLTNVNLFANSSHLDDQRPTVNPIFQGDRTLVDTFAVGLQQQTRLGLRWSLSQNIQRTEIDDAPFVPQPRFYDVFPRLELAMPLWRNLLGRETSAQQDQLRFQAQARLKQAEIAWIQRQAIIEETFYNLLSQQEAYAIQKDSLARAEKILEWSRGRVQRNLVDENDLYQSQAAVAQRRIDLTTAETALKAAARTFNALRGLAEDDVKEKLVGSELDLKRLKLDRTLNRVRKDLKAQSDLNMSQAAGYGAQQEQAKPALDLTVQAQTQGRNGTFTGADRRTFQEQDLLYVGLNFSMPLDQTKASQIRSGFAKLERSQSLLERARLRDELLTWAETVDQAEQIFKQLQLLRDLEVIQRKNADAERSRLNRGRSTTFQVLSFEQTYNTIRAQRIQAEFQARQFLNQLSLFE
ncbi:MAG: TolC family protein [Bdellovibrionales bacterium]